MSDISNAFLELARTTPLANWRFCPGCMVRTEHQSIESIPARATVGRTRPRWQCLTCGEIHELKSKEMEP